MDAPPIRTIKEHRAALREIGALRGAEEGTPAGDRLDMLTRLVEASEERWRAASLNPIKLGGSDPNAVTAPRRRFDRGLRGWIQVGVSIRGRATPVPPSPRHRLAGELEFEQVECVK